METIITARLLVNGPVEKVFNKILILDPALFFLGHGKFPAIVKTTETKRWLRPGIQMIVHPEMEFCFRSA